MKNKIKPVSSTPLKKLYEILQDGEYSLVVEQGAEIYTFKSRGVADLYNIIVSGSDILLGAAVADKIIGKGAAALMIKGGVVSVVTNIISVDALELFQNHGVNIEYNSTTPHIINRAGDGRCPVETLCDNEQNIDKLFEMIAKFVLKLTS